jgi:hypothetical protein
LDKASGNTRFVASLAGLVAAIVLTVSVHGLFARSTQLELAQLASEREALAAARRQDFELRLSLVGRALDPTRSAEDRQRVLRFLHAVTLDAAFKQWAEAELSSLQQDVDSAHEARESADRAAQLGSRAEPARTSASD